MVSVPGPEVLAAFGVADAFPRLLTGGQGVTWQVGDVVVKPVSNVEEAEWVGTVLTGLPERGFRLSRPVSSTAGTWTMAGWGAWRLVDGAHDLTGRWGELLAVGAAFHDALVGVPRPDFLDERRDPWSMGDRVAWEDAAPVVIHSQLGPLVERLDGFRSTCSQPGQVVHGDLTGNVLFADLVAPAIIDFVPYWRPAEFASAIVVADAIAWHHAGLDLAQSLGRGDGPRSMLARAAIYRLITADRGAVDEGDDKRRHLRDNLDAYGRVLTSVLAM